MYCKYCGQSIDDDSLYCKHCGKSIAEVRPNYLSPKIDFVLRWFKSLSRQKQTIILVVGIIWMALISYIIIDGGSHDFYTYLIFPFFLITVITPLSISAIRYIIHLWRVKDNNITQIVSLNQENANNKTVVQAAFSLIDFVSRYGKMQVISDESKRKGVRYCLFTLASGEKTKVNFSIETIWLSSKEIAERKNELYVIQISNGTFELVLEKEIPDNFLYPDIY